GGADPSRPRIARPDPAAQHPPHHRRPRRLRPARARPASAASPGLREAMTEAPHVMIVEARFYEDIADELAKGALAAVEAAGATFERFEVPGAFEIPAAISYAVRSMDFYGGRRRFDGYVALGCVIRGETSHYDYVCGESARKLMDLSSQYALALGYGILTVENA